MSFIGRIILFINASTQGCYLLKILFLCLINRASGSCWGFGFFKPRSHIWLSGFLLCLRFFFFVILSVTNPKPPRMMSSSANDRPFLSSFRQTPPPPPPPAQESFVLLANLTIQTKNGRRRERLIWSNLG